MGKRKLQHRAEEYANLRNIGWTYQEIADHFGCSYQNVCHCLARYKASQFKGFTEERCIYDGLRNWLNENQCSLQELLRRIYNRNVAQGTHIRYAKLLKGETAFTMPDINAIITVTGLTYEELFKQEADNGV